MKKKDVLFGIYMLLFSMVPIVLFSTIMFLTGSQTFTLMWTFIVVGIAMAAFSFKRNRVISIISLLILLGTAGLIGFAAMMSNMSP